MKRILSLALVGVALGMSAQSVTNFKVDNSYAAVQHPGILEIDINNDGYLDMIMCGEMRQDLAGRLVEDANGDENTIGDNTFVYMWNPATNSYDVKEFEYHFGIKAYFACADFNMDGYTDFVVFDDRWSDVWVDEGMFINNKEGGFEYWGFNVLDEEGNMVVWSPKGVAVGDFNSDGRPDLFTAGWNNVLTGNMIEETREIELEDGEKTTETVLVAERARRNYNGVLINNGNYTFTVVGANDYLLYGNNPYEFALMNLTVSDLNNDGYAEFLVMGNVDNEDPADKPTSKTGVEAVGRSFNAYLNMGAEAGDEVILYDLDLANGVSHLYGHGAIQVFDYNNDGVMDILVGGESPDDARGASEWAYHWQLLQGKMNGSDVTYTEVANMPFSDGESKADIRPLSDANRGFVAIDYTGNGHYDLLAGGWCDPALGKDYGAQTGYLFKNENGTYSGYENIPGASEAGIFFTENGVRGARNYGFAGYTEGRDFTWDTDQLGRITFMSTNPNPVSATPAAPANLSQSVDGTSVNLKWEAGEGNLSNVTYEYYIKVKDQDVYFSSANARVGGDLDGLRTIIAPGKAFMAKDITLVNVPNGTFEWGVQTVNAAYVGSKFAKGGEFVVGDGVWTAVKDLQAQPVNARVSAKNGVINVEGEGQVAVYSISGANVFRGALNGSAAINVDGGVYIVKVSTKNGEKVAKVIL